MYLIPIAWIYVVLMMSVAEATNSNGTVIGAVITFVFYGLLPVALLMYILGTPSRKRALRAREMQERAQAPELQAADAQTGVPAPPASDSVNAPDAGGHATTDAVTPVRKEP
jgi:hypothetical protein